jgi:hypothetical protein
MNKIIKIGLIGSLLLSTASSVNAQTLSILEGWGSHNLDYTPVVASEFSAAAINSVVGVGGKVTQGLLVSGDSYGFGLTNITAGKGFFIYNPSTKKSIEINTTNTKSNFSLGNGWLFGNINGYEGELEEIKKDKLFSTNYNIDIMINGILNTNGNTFGTKLNKIREGEGKWFKVSTMTDQEKVRLAKNNFDIKSLMSNSFTNNPNWVISNLTTTSINKKYIIPTFSSSDTSVVSNSGVVTINPTVDKNVTLSFTFTSSSYSETLNLDVFVPSRLTIDSLINEILSQYNEITTYGKGTGANFINGLTTSNNGTVNYKYYVSKPVNDNVYGTESGIDYSVFLDGSGGTFTGASNDKEEKISFDSSYLENGGKFLVLRIDTNEIFDISNKVALSSYENTTDNLVNTELGRGVFKVDITSESNTIDWNSIKGTSGTENMVQSNLILPSTAGNGTSILWETDRKDLIDITTGEVILPNGGYERATLKAHITKGNGYVVKFFNLLLVDPSVKTFSSINDANSGTIPVGEIIMIKDKTVVYNGVDVNGNKVYIDIYTDDKYIDTLTPTFTNGNIAYTERNGVITSELPDGTLISWNSTKSRWERDLDGFVLMPYKNGLTFLNLQELGYKSIGSGSLDNTVVEPKFDMENNLIVVNTTNTAVFPFSKSILYHSIFEGDAFSSNVNDTSLRDTINTLESEQTKGVNNIIMNKNQGLKNGCYDLYGKGWRLPEVSEMTNYVIKNNTNGDNFISKVTKINEAYFSQSNRGVKSGTIFSGNGNKEIAIGGTGSSIPSINTTSGINKMSCVFDGSLY